MPVVKQAPSARLDIYEIWERMALTRPERAQQFVEMLDEKYSLLAENPLPPHEAKVTFCPEQNDLP